MSYNNIIFNVNGDSKVMLRETLELAFKQSGKYPIGWTHSDKYGMILYSNSNSKLNINIFPTKMSAEDVLLLVWNYLKSDLIKHIEHEKWEENKDHDGCNSLGWRVYTLDWGNVENGFLAIKPVYLWYGK